MTSRIERLGALADWCADRQVHWAAQEGDYAQGRVNAFCEAEYEIRQSIAELGQEVGAVAWGVMYPPNHPQAGQIWTTFVGRPEAVEWKDACWNAGDDLIVPLYTSPAHTSEARDATRLDWLDAKCTNVADEYGIASQLYFGTYATGELREAIDAAMRQEGE